MFGHGIVQTISESLVCFSCKSSAIAESYTSAKEEGALSRLAAKGLCYV